MKTDKSLRLVAAIALVAVCSMPLKQTRAASSDPGMWTIFSTTDAFTSNGETSRWQYSFDAQARYSDIGSGINQWLLRPAIGYELRPGVRAWAGYARFRTRNRAGRVSDENRFWQQLDWHAGQWQDGQFTMRARLEQRSVETGDDVGLVLRFLTKYVRPFGSDGNKSLIVGVEPFIDLRDTDWSGESGMAQNRTFVGMGWRLSDRVSLEGGYMNQYVFVDNAQDRMNHLAILTLKSKF